MAKYLCPELIWSEIWYFCFFFQPKYINKNGINWAFFSRHATKSKQKRTHKNGPSSMLSGIYCTVCQAPPINSNGDFFFGWDYVSTMYLLSSTVLTHLNRISTQNFNKDLDQFLIVMFIVFLIIIIFFYEFSFLYILYEKAAESFLLAQSFW